MTNSFVFNSNLISFNISNVEFFEVKSNLFSFLQLYNKQQK